MSTAVRDRLLSGLPAYLDKGPHRAPAVSITFGGACLATVGGHKLRLEPVGAPSEVIELSNLTLAQLVAAVNLISGFTASLLDADAATIGAACLIDVDTQDLAASNRLLRFTSLLWAVVMPMAWAIDDSLDNVRAGVAQASLKTAEGLWVDLWGEEYYGGIMRLVSEADRPYAARIIREVTRWRLNNKALEVIVKEDLGLDATVSNLHDQAWVVGETDFGRFAWRKYSRTTFEVLVEGVVNGLALVIDRNRAAGTLPFFRFRETISYAAPTGKQRSAKVTSYVAIGGDHVWTIGEDGTAIMTSHSRQYTATIIVLAGEGTYGAHTFILGTSVLGGTDLLGNNP